MPANVVESHPNLAPHRRRRRRPVSQSGDLGRSLGYYSTSIHLQASLEAAWAFLSDLHRNEEWGSNVQTVLFVSEGPVGVDTVFRERLRFFGPFHAEGEWRITQFKPPVLHEHQGNIPITGPTTVRYTLEPTSTGCLCTLEVSYKSKPGLFDSLFVAPGLARSFSRNLRRMKKLVEAQPPEG